MTTSIAAPAVVLTDLDPRERRMRWFELAVVTSVAFTSPVIGAVYSFAVGRTSSSMFTQTGLVFGSIARVPPLLLLAYVLWRSGRTFRDIGLRWSWKDAGVGVLLVCVAYIVEHQIHLLMNDVVRGLGYGDTVRASAALIRGYWAQTPQVTPGGFLYLAMNCFFEELLVRAYLMTEIIGLTGSTKIAVAVSVVLQASYHIYYGFIGALTVAAAFLVFALYFAKARKALPCIVGHWLMDVAAVLMRR